MVLNQVRPAVQFMWVLASRALHVHAAFLLPKYAATTSASCSWFILVVCCARYNLVHQLALSFLSEKARSKHPTSFQKATTRICVRYNVHLACCWESASTLRNICDLLAFRDSSLLVCHVSSYVIGFLERKLQTSLFP